VIQVPPTWRDLFASRQQLLQQGLDAVKVPGRVGIKAERWQQSCLACRGRVVALLAEELS